MKKAKDQQEIKFPKKKPTWWQDLYKVPAPGHEKRKKGLYHTFLSVWLP